MDFEKRLFVFLGIVIGVIFLVSIGPGFTGFAVSDYNKVIEYNDVQAGSTIKNELNVVVGGEGIVKELVEVGGEAADWVSLEQKSYVFVPGIVNHIPYTINIPKNVEEGMYKIIFSVISVEDFEKDSILKNQVLQNIEVLVYVGGDEKNGVEVTGFDVFDSEIGDNINFYLGLENQGNVEEDIEINFNVYEAEGVMVATKTFRGKLYAFEKQDIKYDFFSHLKEGDYILEAYVKSEHAIKKLEADFSVFREGALLKKATILGSGVYIKNNKVHVTSFVQNDGVAVLNAYMSGNLGKENFFTEEENILPGDYEIFEYVIEAGDPGDYLLKSNVVYDGIVLEEQETYFYVSDDGVVSLEISFIAILLFVVLALVVSHYVLTKKLKDE